MSSLALQHDLSEGFSTPELARQINGLGRDGWELVSVLRNDAGEERQLVYYFKRPL